ncbi:hypothetical protein SAMN02787142_0582 [Burkholderia sp. WP9]|nr:hypothetical protein SAMN02787142_0582 [Burkholderia sp. WP9]
MRETVLGLVAVPSWWVERCFFEAHAVGLIRAPYRMPDRIVSDLILLFNACCTPQTAALICFGTSDDWRRSGLFD